jgi:hypothetical protein
MLASPARADALTDALFAYDHGAGPKAVELLTPLAEAGVVRAQEALLHVYAYGEGVPKDQVLTLKWSLRAASEWSAIGENSVGASYAKGEAGLKQDLPEALRWIRIAAARGNAKANYVLGQYAMFGLAGFAKDQVLGAEYVKVAADGGYEPAMLVEATLLDFGNGVPKDEDLAERYLRRAALAGNTNADILLGLKLLNKPPSAAKAAEGVKWLLVADFEGCEQGLHLVAQLSKNLPKGVIDSGVADATDWSQRRPPRDPHVHAEDPTDGCPPPPVTVTPSPPTARLAPATVTKTHDEVWVGD